MQHILVYGDSLAWGIVPGTRSRLSFEQRWPGLLELGLRDSGQDVRVIEDCLNGRRTVFEDPYKAGRNGLIGLQQRIEVNSPLDLVVLALGTNDFQSMHPHKAWHAQQGMAALIRAVRSAPIEPGMPEPPILIVCPPPVGESAGTMADKFAGGNLKCVGLAEAYASLAQEMDCAMFDSGAVIQASEIDGVHLGAEQHAILGHALIEPILNALPETS